jgi:hypothetical protein
MVDLVPDLSQAERFLSILDPAANCRSLLEDYADGFSFQCFDDVKGRKDRTLARVIHGTLSANANTLVALNKRGAGIFVTINETNMRGRTLSDLTRVRAIWQELDDGIDFDTQLEPHLVTETSPGKRHKIYLVDGLTFAEHQAVQDVLVAEYGSDKNAKDLARVLRVPGFWHQKGEPFMSRLVDTYTGAPYPADLVLKVFTPSTTRSSPAKPALQKEPKQYAADYTPLDDLDSQLPLPDITLENCVKYLPPAGDQSYSEWRDIGMALHHQFYGSDEALAIFDDWSGNVREYKGYDDVAATWSSFGKRTTGSVVTFKTLVKEYKKRQIKSRTDQIGEVYDKAKNLLKQCHDHTELTGVIAPQLWHLAGGIVSVEKDFRQYLIQRFAELRDGETLSQAEANRALKSKRVSAHAKAVAEAAITDLGYRNPRAPGWTDDWVWVSADEVFFNINTGVELTSRGFCGQYNSQLPKGDGAPTSAAAYAQDNLFVPKVMRRMYMPGTANIFAHDGVSCVNTYSDRYRCPVPDALDDVDDIRAVELMRRHIEYICGGWNREAQIFCNFLAACVGTPPVKVRWAVLLVGTFGDGKSLFYQLLMNALGSKNARTIKGSTIASSAKTSFTGWVEGHCLGFIEEIKWHGHNRYEIVNSIKDVLTNSVVECHQKGRETKDVHNTANYFLTTNYADAVPMEKGDRRYFMLESRVPLDKISAEEPDYFYNLTNAIQHHSGAIVRWLLDMPRHVEFDPDRPAPMTEAKQNAIRLAVDDVEELITEIIEFDNDPLCCNEAICFGPLFQKLQNKAPGAIKSDQDFKVSRALVAMGFAKSSRVSVAGERHTIWGRKVAGKLPPAETLRDILNNRATKSEAEGLSDLG